MSYKLFEVFGIEMEYMIVRKNDLNVYPVADSLLKDPNGEIQNEVEKGAIAWSNELVSHVLEFKTNGPTRTLENLAQTFHHSILQAKSLLSPLGGTLLGTSMHPWMQPDRETKLWQYGQNEIYEEYNKIFGCKGHGWSNLQSVHLNLPFSTEDEFVRLHSAIRIILPLLPALSASSPLREGAWSGWDDTRIYHYQTNQKRIPSIAGSIIPEPIQSIQDYHEKILEPMYRDIAPFDPEGILQDEWLNSRGAIARFDRSAIEIRVLDIQECPNSDFAILERIIALLQFLCSASGISESILQFPTDRLAAMFQKCAKESSSAVIEDSEYLALFGLDSRRVTARELWQHLSKRFLGSHTWSAMAEDHFASYQIYGTLSEKIKKNLGGQPSDSDTLEIYRKLEHCLEKNEWFPPNL